MGGPASVAPELLVVPEPQDVADEEVPVEPDDMPLSVDPSPPLDDDVPPEPLVELPLELPLEVPATPLDPP